MCPNAIPAKQCVAVGRGGELRAEWLAQTDKQSGRRRLVCMHQHENVDRARAERIFKAREFQKDDTKSVQLGHVIDDPCLAAFRYKFVRGRVRATDAATLFCEVSNNSAVRQRTSGLRRQT